MGTHIANTFPKFGITNFLHALKKPPGSHIPTPLFYRFIANIFRRRKTDAANQKGYICWGCDKNYIDPADFLWHIQFCNSINSYQATEVVALEETVTK